MLDLNRAQEAMESRDDVFTASGYAVVIAELRTESNGTVYARCSGNGGYSDMWVSLNRLTTSEDYDESRPALDASGIDVSAVVEGYVECALWSSVDEEGESLNELFSAYDIATPALDEMRGDVEDFLQGVLAERPDVFAGINDGQIGHDFWLTRNRHGAGFWDRGLGECGDYLTQCAHAYGEQDLYVGDDGLLYI
jgi:hypothetical protein